MFAALLDTCVLWPSLQRDFLLTLAVEGLYRPLWSTAILRELETHTAGKHIKHGDTEALAWKRATHLVTQMRQHFDDACVLGWEPLDGTYDLPDRDDEHVVAAAVVGGAGAIITQNTKDFPAAKIPPSIQVKSPAVFAAETVEIAPHLAVRALQAIAGRFREPPRSTDELLGTLAERYKMTDAVDIMRAQLA